MVGNSQLPFKNSLVQSQKKTTVGNMHLHRRSLLSAVLVSVLQNTPAFNIQPKIPEKYMIFPKQLLDYFLKYILGFS